MAFPTIIYNASTGSDTAASGSGPASALTGSAATNGTGAVVNLDGSPDLSGVATDGSAALWVNSATTNRHLSRIVAVDNGAKTVTTNETLVLGGGVSWAIGGKRQTLNNDTGRRDWADINAGWTFEFEAGTYDTPVTIDAAAGDATSGPVAFRAASGASPILRTTANLRHFNFKTMHRYVGLGITTNSGTKTSTMMGYPPANAYGVLLRDCVIDGLNSGLETYYYLYARIIGCEVKNCTSNGIAFPYGFWGSLSGCNIHDNGAAGISVTSAGSDGNTISIIRCLIEGNTGDGIVATADWGHIMIFGCTIDGNSDGIQVTGTWHVREHLGIVGNLISNNGSYGINCSAGADNHAVEDFNAFYNNATADLNNVTAGANDVTLTADPYTNQAGGDFSLNDTAGGGAACIDAGFPGILIGSSTDAETDIGVAQGTPGAGSGGGILVHPGMSGGMRG